jgi:hypothetical protein
MTVRQYRSPDGSPPIVGTSDLIFARANIHGIDEETHEPEYEGYTEVFWDTQTTRTRDRKPLWLDEDGNEWTFDQLVPVDDDAEEAEEGHP